MKNPPFNSLVWGSLRLAPIILLAKKCNSQSHYSYSWSFMSSMTALKCGLNCMCTPTESALFSS